MKLNKLRYGLSHKDLSFPGCLWYLDSSISVCVASFPSSTPPLIREAQSSIRPSYFIHLWGKQLDVELGLLYGTALADNPDGERGHLIGIEEVQPLLGSNLGVWEVDFRHGCPRPSLQMSHSWPLCSSFSIANR